MRGYLVPLAVYCGGCRELAAATPSPLRALPSCFGVPHRLQFTTRANYFGGGQAFGALRQWSALRPLGAGGLPALSVPHAGPQLPAAPPGLRPESGCRATPSVFVGSRQPPVTRGTRHGRCVPRLQGAAALRGRVSGGWRLGRASARALFSLGGLPLYRSLVAYGVLRASLRSARGTP